MHRHARWDSTSQSIVERDSRQQHSAYAHVPIPPGPQGTTHVHTRPGSDDPPSQGTALRIARHIRIDIQS